MFHKINIEEKKIFLVDKDSLLDIDDSCELSIIVRKNIKARLIIIGKKDYILNIKLEKNSILEVNSININNNVSVSISLYEKSVIIYNHSVLAHNNSVNNFSIKHIANDASSTLNNNGINILDNNLFFTISGIIPKNLSNIYCSQNSKIINFAKGNSKIIPNLIIDSKDVVANHSAYIGRINEEELFYLKSRGINLEEIKEIIYKSIMLGKMSLSNEKEMIIQYINEWW